MSLLKFYNVYSSLLEQIYQSSFIFYSYEGKTFSFGGIYIFFIQILFHFWIIFIYPYFIRNNFDLIDKIFCRIIIIVEFGKMGNSKDSLYYLENTK